jgi:hypothetical protein
VQPQLSRRGPGSEPTLAANNLAEILGGMLEGNLRVDAKSIHAQKARAYNVGIRDPGCPEDRGAVAET